MNTCETFVGWLSWPIGRFSSMDAQAQLQFLDNRFRERQRFIGWHPAPPGVVRDLGNAVGAEAALRCGQFLGDGDLALDQPLPPDVVDLLLDRSACLHGRESREGSPQALLN